MLFVWFFLGFKLHSNQELKFEETTGKFINRESRTSNKKSVKAALFGCGQFSNSFPTGDSGWEPGYASGAPYLHCEGTTGNLQNIIISQTKIGSIQRRTNTPAAFGLYEIINANFECTTNQFYANGARTPFSQLFYFNGAGNHVFTGSKFIFCGLNNNGDSSLFYIDGSSTNVFTNIEVRHPPQSEALSPQGWEIDTQRTFYLAGSASLSVSKSKLYNCTSTTYGGAVRIESTGRVVLSESTFEKVTDRSSSRVNGIYVHQEGGTYIHDCNFIDCGNAGAIIWSDGNNIIITLGKIEFTDVLQSCCGVYLYKAGNYSIDGMLFKKCGYNGKKHALLYECGETRPDEFSVKNCIFDNCHCDEEGRAMKLSLKIIKSISNCIFRNFAEGTSILYIDFLTTYDEFSIENNVFENNVVSSTGKGGGAGIYVTNTIANGKANPLLLNIKICTFKNNYCKGKGGAYQVGAGSIYTTSIVFEDCEFLDNRADAEGGALCIQTTRVCNITKSKFIRNKSTKECGCIYIESDVNTGEKLAKVNILNCDFDGNYGEMSHCIYFKDGSESLLEVLDCSFKNNYNNQKSADQLQGSCILTNCKEVRLHRNVFNSDDKTKSCGGINVTSKSILDVQFCSFVRCNAGTVSKSYGGGIGYKSILDRGSTRTEDIKIYNCTFEDCMGENGIALLIWANTYPNIEKVYILNNIMSRYIFCIFYELETDGTDYILRDIHFTGNSCDNGGGDSSVGSTGIWIAESEENKYWNALNLVFEECTFEYNYAPGNGGAFAYEGSQRLQAVELTFRKCTFLHNSCGKQWGGACRFGTTKPVTISECEFYNNSATGQQSGGGAILIGESVSLFTLYKSTFRKCRGSIGAFIFSAGRLRQVNISFCSFSEIDNDQNNSIYIEIDPLSSLFNFESNTFARLRCIGQDGGSGLHIVTNKDCEISSCQFISCVGKTDREGQITIPDDSNYILTFYNCTFEDQDNVQDEGGRAISIKKESGVRIDSCIFKNFWHPSNTGLAMRSESRTKSNTFFNCSFEGIRGWSCIHFEYCQVIDMEVCRFTNVKSRCATGIIYQNHAVEYKMRECIFDDCGGSDDNSGTYHGGTIVICDTVTKADFTSCTFVNCWTVQRNVEGGAIRANGNVNLEISVDSCVFKNCSCANNFGSCVYIHEGAKSAIMVNNTFGDNTRIRAACVYSRANSLTFENNTIEDKVQDSPGYGLHVSRSSILKVRNNIFKNTHGASALLYNPTEGSEDDDVLVEGNLWDGCGGGSYRAFQILAKNKLIFRYNTIQNSPLENIADDYIGWLRGPDMIQIENCKFMKNSAQASYGGGCGILFSNSNPGNSQTIEFNSCTFKENHANMSSLYTVQEGKGGAVQIGGSSSNIRNSVLHIYNCLFEDNIADREGGAVSLQTASVGNIIDNCTFINNQAGKENFGNAQQNNKMGGALYLENSDANSDYKVTRCLFKSNKGGNNGHSIFGNCIGKVTITDQCSFIDNTNQGGSQITNSGQNFILTKCIVELSNYLGSSNKARGLELLSNGKMTVFDTIFRSIQTQSGEGNAILVGLNSVEATIYNTTFLNCGNSGYVVSCYGKKLNLYDNTFDFVNPTVSCGCVNVHTTGEIKIERNYFQKTIGSPALTYNDENQGSNPDLLIDSNIFEKCVNSPACYNLNARHEINFQNNIIQNNNPGSGRYLGILDFKRTMAGKTYTFLGNKFINNTCSSDYGGGIGFWCVNKIGDNVLENAFTLKLENCYFENNHAVSRGGIAQNGHTGHGGALQFGWTFSESNVYVTVSNCKFIKNNADLEGGALSIQTIFPIEIIDCVFDGNRAGLASSGNEGYIQNVGGALYFEPDFDWPQSHFNDLFCESILISNTTIKNNGALNASALFIKGGKATTVTLKNNCQIVDNGNSDSSIICSSKEIIIQDSSFKFSDDTKRARGMDARCKTTLSNVEFINNYNMDDLGHAFHHAKDSGEIKITKCKFVNCGDGGDSFSAVVLESAPIRFENSTVEFLNVTKACKAVFINVFGNVEILNNTIKNTLSSGALAYIPVHGNVLDENVLIEDNIFDNCDGSNTRCFNIKASSNNVLFHRNTIQNCPDRTYLGKIELVGLESFTFEKCVFRNLVTHADFGGGSGVWIINDRKYDLIYSKCIFENCHSRFTGFERNSPNGLGGALQYGWSPTISNVNIKLFGCSFKGNKADRDGGAVCLMVQGVIEIEDCLFENNVAGLTENATNKFNGGAIAIYPNYDHETHDITDTITINNCKFIGNRGSDANGIYVQNAPKTSVHIQDNCLFTDNSISGKSSSNSVIVVEAKLLNINSIVMNFTNVGTSCRGIDTNAATVAISSSKFFKCAHSTGAGNALLVQPQVTKCSIESCVFTDNGNNAGSVIETKTKEFVFDDCTINFTNKTTAARGILIPYGCKFYLLDSTFNRCRIEAGSSGSAFEYQGAEQTNFVENINILSCVFDDNSSPYASCFKLSTSIIPTIKDITVKNHQRGQFIVVILFIISLRREVIVDHWLFDNNYYLGSAANPDCGGCGLWIAPMKTNPGFKDSWPLTFDTCTWKGNRAGYVGGAFAYGNSNTLRYIYLNFTKCKFENNYCETSFGGALWFNSQVPVKIDTCTFNGNYAKGERKGNALYISTRCTCIITDTKFIDNGDSNLSSVIQVSGNKIDLIRSEISFTKFVGCRGIHIDYPTTASFINSTFLRCNAGDNDGGAIYFNNKEFTSILEEDFTIEGCRFEGNLAKNGCAMLLNMSTVPKLYRNTFINQNSGKYIIGIFFTQFKDICVVESCIFKNCMNNAGEDGGGSGIWIANQEEISNKRPAELIFRSCVWENNTTPNRGGAFHYGNSATLVGVELTFDKCTFTGNSAFNDGGAVSLVTRSPIIFNECKFSGNTIKNKTASVKTRACSIFVSSNTPLVQVLGCQFTNETANDGNAIYLTNIVPACFISGCIFKDCGTTGTVVVSETQELLFQNTDVEFTKIDKACRGLDIKTISITTITKSRFIRCKVAGTNGNVKDGRGGGIYLDNELKSEEQEEFTLENCVFDGCLAANGCAILLKTSSLPTIRGNIIQNHRSGNYIFGIFGNVYFQDVFTIESCTFNNNNFPNDDKRDGGGSGFWVSNDQMLLPGTPTKLVFKKCNWTRNSATYGGAISYGKSTTLQNTEMVFEGCVFDNNQASGEQGGALYLITVQPIRIEGCTFTKNKALGNVGPAGSIAVGGACVFDTNATSIIISNTVFSSNSAQNGNALWVQPKCSFVDIVNCDFASNSNGKVGSQIAHQGKEIHFTNTKIRFEAVTLHAKGIEILSKSRSYFVGCSFYLCETDGVGGGLHVQDTLNSANVEELTLDGCTFDNCDASSGAALLCNITCNPTISKCTVKNIKKGHFIFVIFFYQKHQEFVTLDDCTFQNNQYSNTVANPDGGGCGLLIAPVKELYNGTTSKLVFNKCNFIGNKASHIGGAVSYGSSLTLKSTFLQFKDSLFDNNVCDGSEGGALWVTSDAQLLVSGCTFKNNKANGLNNKGGAIFINSPSEYCQIYNSIFETPSSSEGNAIFAGDQTKNIQIYGCNFINCGTFGSVITSNSAEIHLSSSNIRFDSVDNSARGLELKQKAKVTLSFVNFINCKTTGNGGGVYLDFSAGSRNEYVSLADCVFDNNNANGGCAVWGANINVQPIISGNTIKNCRNERYIFVLMFSTYVNTINVENGIFENNKYNTKNSPEDSGGCGIWIANNKGLADDKVTHQTFTNCLFSKNEAIGVGGAYSLGFSLTMKNTQLTFESCNFIGNKAGKEGGALYIQTRQPVLISKCKFDGNMAASHGGALYIALENSNVTIEYTQIARNNATGSAGALYIVNSDNLEMTNNTFSENAAVGNMDTLYLKNEGTVKIHKNNFDFTRTSSDQYQIQFTGVSTEGSIDIKDSCFTHKGRSDETITHIKSDTASSISLLIGNCFDVKEILSIQHNGGGILSKANGIFDCSKCEDVYIPTVAPEATPKATPQPTILPTEHSTKPSASQLPTWLPSTIVTTTTVGEDEGSNKGNSKNVASVGMITGVVIAAVAIIVVVLILVWLFVFKNRVVAKKSDSANASEMNDETISGITGIDSTNDDPIWAGATATNDNPLFNGGDEQEEGENMIQNDFEESWGNNVI